MSIKYDAAADQLIFTGAASVNEWEHSTHVTISRGLIASELATALGLRQPENLGEKPAKS